MWQNNTVVTSPRTSFIEGPHPLLEPRSPAYSNATVRRAFIVWLHCGQRNSFKDVCNYYHYLEILEEELPADRKASSRYLEFNMFSAPPPTSSFLDQIYPKLYSLNNVQHYLKHVDTAKHETVFKLELFTDLKSQNSVTTKEILDTSDMIRTYCNSHKINLKKFLDHFKVFAKICELSYTVGNVASYIKRKMLEEELLMIENYSKSLNFLNLSDVQSDTIDLKNLHTSVFLNLKIETRNGTGERVKFAPNTSQNQILSRDKRDLTNQYCNDWISIRL